MSFSWSESYLHRNNFKIKKSVASIFKYRKPRECFIPAPGNKLIIADYSQIELRVAAEISQDSRMIAAYKQGQDLHKLTASLIMDKALDELIGDERQAAKAVNFGLIFGMGPQGLKKYAQNTFGVNMTEQEAILFRERFFNAYQGISRWHQQEKQSSRRETRTLIGRRREWKDDPELPVIPNTPVQGTAADIIKKALTPEAMNETRTMIIGCVHDEIIFEAPEDKAEHVAQILKETMEIAVKTLFRFKRQGTK